jgi:hypothetical protein
MSVINIYAEKMNLMLGVLIALILISSISVEHAIAQFGYSLEVFSVGSCPCPMGVVLSVENQATGALRYASFPGTPISSYTFFFDSYEMPAGSPFNVCVLDVRSQQVVNCEGYSTGFSSSEYVTFNLSPFGFQ